MMTPIQMAKIVAKKAVDNAHPFKQEEYYGDGFCEPISSISGLAEEILDLFEYEHPNTKPTINLLEDIAFDLV